MAARNEEIYARWYAGESVQELAERYDRKPVVIGRIIAKRHPELKDDTGRALLRGRLEWLLSEMREVILAPGWKMQPNGRVAEGPDGEAAVDMGARTEAAKVFLAVLDRQAKLDATDKPAQQHVKHEHEFYQNQAAADIAQKRAEFAALQLSVSERQELDMLRRSLAAPPVRGEVIAELPPANGQEQQREGEAG